MSLVPQLGMAELLLLAIIALVVVGPKDLPKLLHQVGKGMRHLRKMADEFRSSFDQMAREAELDEMRKEIEELKKANPARPFKEAMDDVTRAVESDQQSATAPIPPREAPAPTDQGPAPTTLDATREEEKASK